ncbi:MAG: hypothetical protein AAFP89_05140 [Bacteroidota bacterium]
MKPTFALTLFILALLSFSCHSERIYPDLCHEFRCEFIFEKDWETFSYDLNGKEVISRRPGTGYIFEYGRWKETARKPENTHFETIHFGIPEGVKAFTYEDEALKTIGLHWNTDCICPNVLMDFSYVPITQGVVRGFEVQEGIWEIYMDVQYEFIQTIQVVNISQRFVAGKLSGW